MALAFSAPAALPGDRPAAPPTPRDGGAARPAGGYGGARGRSRPSVRCQAAPSVPVDRLPLSSYAFPALPSGGGQRATPLEEAVREAVLHLDQAPFLQLQTGGRTVRHSVDDEAILDEPQLWKGIGRHLAERGVGEVLLIHPLEAPACGQAPRCVSGAGEVISGMGITDASRRSELLSFAELVRAGVTPADFFGRVGDCCDGEEHSQVVAFTRREHRHRHRRAAAERAQAAAERAASHGQELQPAQYWGVVLQSAACGRCGGCYVLKTCASRIDDCTCVHWSLTRVRSGAPLYDQLSSAWLLPQ